MSLGRTFLSSTKFENELDQFLNHLSQKFNIPKKEMVKCMAEFKSSGIVQSTIVNTAGESVSMSHPTIPSARGSSIHSSSQLFEGRVKRPDGKIVQFGDEPKLPTQPQVVISQSGDRYTLQVKPSFLASLTNQNLKRILTRKSLSVEEYNHLKYILNQTEIPFSDVVQKVKEEPKITNVEEIMKRVQQDMRDAEQLTPQDRKVETQKLKLIKVGDQLAWDKNTKYLFRLTKENGKTVPVAIATRTSKTDPNVPLTASNIDDLNTRGWKFESKALGTTN